MGCAQSRIENEESVSRCKDRKILMKEAVVARNAFAAGHSGYAVALKNTGAALSDYAHGESEEAPQLHHPHPHPHSLEPASQPPPPPPPPPIENLPPPPPLPNFSPSPTQLTRSATMPEIPMKLRKNPNSIAIMEEEHEEEEEEEGLQRSRKETAPEVSPAGTTAAVSPRTPEMKSVPPMPESKGIAWDYFFMVDNIPGSSLGAEEEEEEEAGVENDEHDEVMDFGQDEKHGEKEAEVEPKTPEKVAEETEGKKKAEEMAVAAKTTIEHLHTAPADFRRVGKAMAAGAPSVSLVQVLSQIDDHFLKASEGAQEVSKMLEATRLHYHSNFADNRGL